MENKQSPSNKKLLSAQEEKLIREVDYDSFTKNSSHPPRKLFLEIFQKGQSSKHPSQKVLVSIKPKTPVIKTIYIAEKSRYRNKKNSELSGSRLALGDHSSFTTHLTDNTLSNLACTSYLLKNRAHSEIITEKTSTSTCIERAESSTEVTRWTYTDVSSQDVTLFNENHRYTKNGFNYNQPQVTMTIPKVDKIADITKNKSIKVDAGILVELSNPSKGTLNLPGNIIHLNKRIEYLERKVLRQEMVFRSINPKLPLSSSDEEQKVNTMRATSSAGRPGCSYVEYSQIPETSAFQRYSQQTAPLSASKATTIQKEHNSEQYGRDFTLYDGITARARRQCASVPCKRDDGSRLAADRVHKIRHKLNPVRDYRLMDTVHYLAQGEFAPRDDGIKLTPSREAVLSDIIWEDVCRTHWPNTRLARRAAHPERCGTRSDLQRLIDSLLRERVAHVERRRRRHYRIVKLNHRHENCRPVGKTGDIIVASHKARSTDRIEDKEEDMREHKRSRINEENRIINAQNSCKILRSREPLPQSEKRRSRHFKEDECSPGPSYMGNRTTIKRDPTCCYHTLRPAKHSNDPKLNAQITRNKTAQEFTSDSSTTTTRGRSRQPRLVIKKNSSLKKHTKEEPNLEHFLLLPTLVVKTPSNMKRQKKFNELYHRILNVQMNRDHAGSNDVMRTQKPSSNTRDVGLNINVTLSNSEENFMQ